MGIWIDCLNGDKYKTGKVTPDGDPDPSIFSTDRNREGIQVGTAIALFARKEAHEPASRVRFRHLWGKTKREQLIETAQQDGTTLYEEVAPSPELGLPFVPGESNPDYFKWPSLSELFPVSFPGVKTSRDDFLVDIDRDRLVRRLELYFDPEVGHEQMARVAPGVMEHVGGFDPIGTRDRLRKRGFLPSNIMRYCYRPFDVRWLYWEPETKLLDRNRADYFPHVFEGNVWMLAQQKPRREWSKPQFILGLGCLDLMDRGANCAPLRVALIPGAALRLDDLAPSSPALSGLNLSPLAIDFVSGLCAQDDAAAVFYHSLGVLHAPSYAKDNGSTLRQD